MAFDFEQPSYKSLKKIFAERTSPVVAWVGAGLSAPAGLPSWEGLLSQLVAQVKRKHTLITPDEKKRHLESILVEEFKKKNYWLCFQLLEQLLGETSYHAEIREKLDTSRYKGIPEGYGLLWKAGIQGIVSLNLDQFASRSFSKEFPGDVLDHFVGDQSRHLAAVLQRNRPFVGDVHGVIDNSSTWIFTHEKLSNLLSDTGYMRFISGCLLSRTVLFVGVSADDVAVETHLKSVKDAGLTGINHYWLTSRNDAETDVWSERFNVRPIIYSDENNHAEAIECLRDLAKISVSVDAVEQLPVLMSSIEVASEGVLEDPDEIVIKPLEDIRRSLNSHALEILRESNDEAYARYEEFSEKYDEAIDRAWYVSKVPPKNMLLGYKIGDRISQGAFGDVYDASISDGSRVAIKLLRRDVRREPSMLQAFRRGVRSMKILKSRKIAGMVEYLDASEIPAFVAMQWVDGPNLAQAVETRIISTWEDIILVARDVANIIYSAHCLPERVLHRDIRPPNIMLKDYWTNGNEIEVVVMDFDLSWHIDAMEQSIVSRPMGFMAPEQLNRRPKESTRSALVDSFGLGMTIYYMVTSDVPVPSQHKHIDWGAKLLNRVRSKPFGAWCSLPFRVMRLIEGSTQDYQRDRWDFAKVVSELENLSFLVNGEFSGLPVDYLAEEVAARAETMHNYKWDEDVLAAVYNSGGLFIKVSASAPRDEIQLMIEWKQTGDENWKLVPQTSAQVKERARPILEKHGWSGTEFEASLRLMRVMAVAEPRSFFDPKNLAKGLDRLVQVMLPRN